MRQNRTRNVINVQKRERRVIFNQPNIIFYVLLTVHLSIFILVINQLDAQNLFYNKFISCLYMFRAPCAHRQEVKIVFYSRPMHRLRESSLNLCMGRPPIGVMIPEAVEYNFDLLTMGTWCSKHVEA